MLRRRRGGGPTSPTPRSTPTATASPTRSPATCGTTKPKSRWATTAKSLLSGVDLPGTNNSSPSPQCRRASASAAAGPARDRAADLKWCEGAAQALAAKAARKKVAANGRVEVHDLG